LARTGDLTSARQRFEESLEVAKGLAKANPIDPEAEHDVAVSLDRLGDLLLTAGVCLIKTFCARKMNQFRYGVVSTLGCCWGNERYSGLWLSENGRKSRQTTAAFREV